MAPGVMQEGGLNAIETAFFIRGLTLLLNYINDIRGSCHWPDN